MYSTLATPQHPPPSLVTHFLYKTPCVLMQMCEAGGTHTAGFSPGPRETETQAARTALSGRLCADATRPPAGETGRTTRQTRWRWKWPGRDPLQGLQTKQCIILATAQPGFFRRSLATSARTAAHRAGPGPAVRGFRLHSSHGETCDFARPPLHGKS